MASIKERVDAVRKRHPVFDHGLRTQEHFGEVRAGQQAGAVTYFGFLSFFPILALAFFVVGWIAKVYAGAEDDLIEAVNAVVPGLVGSGEGQVQISDIERAAGTVGLIGGLVLLYSGLGWLAAMRDALVTVFEIPPRHRPGLVSGKLRDLATLALIGTVLLVSVAVAGLVGGFSHRLLDLVGLGAELGWLVKLLTVLLGLAANMVLFFAMFVLLAGPNIPRRTLWSGALLGAVAFEILKQISGLLIQSTQGKPAFQAFGIALIVLVWIHYFSQVVLYAAAWAHTAPAARAARPDPVAAPVQGPPSPPVRARDSELEHPAAAPFLGGALTMLGLVTLLRRFPRRS